jgi:Na+/melibiose symporter-like transporter
VTSTTEAPPISRRLKLFYGSGAVAFGVKDNGFGYFLLFFYSQVVGLPADWVSTALMVALILDAAMDIVIGQVSDNWRSKLGRRHPFMYASAIPLAVAFVLLWNPPDASQPVVLAWFVGMMLAVRVFISLYEIPSSALVPELTSDYNERTSFFSYRYFFAWWGGLGLTLIALRFLMRPDENHAVGQLNPAGYSLYGFVAAAVILVAILTATIGTQSRVRYLRPPPPRRPFNMREVAGEMFGTFANRSFMALMLAGVAGNIAIGLGAGLYLYINTYFWELSADQLALLLPGSFIGSAIGAAIAPTMSRRFGKRATAVALCVIAVVVSFAPIVMRLFSVAPANDSPLLMPLLFVAQTLSIVMGVCGNVMISSMLTDVVEESELKTGRRSEGLVLVANTFVAKCVTGVGIFASGVIVATVDFPRGAAPGSVPWETLRNLVLLYLPAQAVLYFLAIWFLSRYRITRGSHEATLAHLAAKATSLESAADPAPR